MNLSNLLKICSTICLVTLLGSTLAMGQTQSCANNCQQRFPKRQNVYKNCIQQCNNNANGGTQSSDDSDLLNTTPPNSNAAGSPTSQLFIQDQQDIQQQNNNN